MKVKILIVVNYAIFNLLKNICDFFVISKNSRKCNMKSKFGKMLMTARKRTVTNFFILEITNTVIAAKSKGLL